MTALAVLPAAPADAAVPTAVDDAYFIPEEGTSAGNYVFDQVWPGFHRPFGVAVDSAGTVYVMDSLNSQVKKYDSDGTLLTSWGSSGQGHGQFFQAQGIAVDPTGTVVYVADGNNNRIQKFTSDGAFLRMWGWGVDTDPDPDAYEICTIDTIPCYWGSSGTEEGKLYGAYGVAVSPDGSTVYAVDWWNERVSMFSSDGAYLGKWGSFGTGDGQFTSNWGLEVQPATGNVYVADTHGDRIQWFTPDGAYLGQLGSIGYGFGELLRPHDIAFDSAGNIFVADSANNRIQQFSPAGAPIGQWGGIGTGSGQLTGPSGVDVGPGDVVYVADTHSSSGRVQKFIPAPNGVLSNDSDGDGDPLTAVLDTDVGNGTLTLNSDGTFLYTPDLNWNGVDSFTYRASDGGSLSDPATVTITVAPYNDPPVAVDDEFEILVDETLVVAAPGIVANDTDVEGHAFIDTFRRDNVDHGTLDFQDAGVGSFTYTPEPGFVGTDSFTYYVRDSEFGNSNDATVTITVTPVGEVFYVDQSATGADDGSSWADAFVELQSALAVAFSGDSIRVAKGTYLPDFDVTTGTHSGDTSAVFQTVHEVDMLGGFPPGGGSESNPTLYPTVLSGDLGGNDAAGVTSDNSVTVVDVSNTHMRLENFTITAAVGQGVDGDNTGVLIGGCLIDDNHGRGVNMRGPLSVFFAGTTISNNSAGSGPGGGVYLTGSGVAPRFSDVVIEGNTASSGVGAFIEGTVTMYNTVFLGNAGAGGSTDGGALKLVGGPGDESIVMNGAFIGNEANVGSAIVVDGGVARVVNSTFTGNVAASAGGTLLELVAGTLHVDNSILWNNFGSDSTAGAIVAFSINGNTDVDPRFADADGPDDIYGTFDDDVRLLGTSPAIDSGHNAAVPPDSIDLDNDGDNTEPASHDLDHQLRFFDRANPDTGSGTPPIVDMGAYELGNTPPNAGSDQYALDEGANLEVTAPGVLGNDEDDEGDLLAAVLIGDVANGDLVLGADGSFTYTPNAGFSGTDTFSYLASDGARDSNVATVTIVVHQAEPGGPPGADDWSFDMDEGGTVTGSVLRPGEGGDGCVVTVALVSGVAHGTLTLFSDGSFTYVHDGTAATTDSFTYKVLCGGLESRVATVTITIGLLSYSVGLVDPATGEWHLRSSFTAEVESFYYGDPGDVPFMGDWDCDGIDTPGLFRLSDAYAYLRNANSQGVADIRFFFGDPGDVPLPGDFNGDGCDTLSLYRPSNQTFYIINELGENEGGLGAADFSFVFGNPGDKPVVGDWDGDGITEIGLHRETTGFFYWRDTLTTGIASDDIFFGDPGDRFVAGDFGVINGFDTPAVFRPSNSTFYFRHSLTEGVADSQFAWGNPTWMPVAGVTG